MRLLQPRLCIFRLLLFFSLCTGRTLRFRTAQDEEHDDRLVAEPGEKTEGFQKLGFVGEMLEVHEKKSSQVAKHDGECRHSTDQIKGIRGRWGELARHPAERNGRGQPRRNSSLRWNRSRCHKFPSEAPQRLKGTGQYSGLNKRKVCCKYQRQPGVRWSDQYSHNSFIVRYLQ